MTKQKNAFVIKLLFLILGVLFCCFLKLNSPEDSNKRQKTIQDVLSEGTGNSSFHLTFGHVVAICRARIPFIQLREEVHVDRRQPFVLI